MGYAIVFDRQALDRIPFSTPPSVVNCIEAAFNRLSASPTTESRPAVFPFPPHSQMFYFECYTENQRYRLRAFFRYSVDEQRLLVFDVTCVIDDL